MELKVFTLPTCSSCPVAKRIASEVAQKFGIAFREVNMATTEGLSEGLASDIMSAPTIVIDKEVLARGRLISKERLEEEIKTRIEKWKERAITK
ncbi:thioredoxin family protein [Candidatus Bathyarchaeota archaeon]|nr:thioredoxin family protein [Candidatus Bathyarchaeota archaeon]